MVCGWLLTRISSFLLLFVDFLKFPRFSIVPPAHNLYPLRITVVNEEGEDAWLTVAYIPIVHQGKEPGAEGRSRKRRSAILQRVLYLVFRSAIAASHVGVKVRAGNRDLLCFPRMLLYIFDLPEEKGLLCLKGGKTALPCSMCTVRHEAAVTPEALEAVDRDAPQVLGDQIEASGLQLRKERPSRRLMLEKKHSAHSVMPALAAMAGLSTPPFHMYKIIGVDVLHVLDLGLTRMLVHGLVRVYPHVCAAAGCEPACGGTKGVCRVAIRRFDEMGRRSKASLSAPGYVWCTLFSLTEFQLPCLSREITCASASCMSFR